jgi:hypothetical protein
MAKAGDGSSTSWISHAAAVELLKPLYQSKAEEIIRVRGLITGRVPWGCAKLTGQQRKSDPGNGNPDFWKREHRGVLLQVRPHENWARRRVLQAGKNQRHAVLCDYQAFGIKLGKEGVIGLLPADAQAAIPKPISQQKPRPPGPSKGSSRYAAGDRKFFPRMRKLIAKGESVSAAALVYGDNLKGGGTSQSKARRLAKLFSKENLKS